MMEAKPKPTAKRGSRNVFCEYYNNCLDHAIDQSWSSWNCVQCELNFSQPIEEFEVEMPGAEEDVIYYGSHLWNLDNIMAQFHTKEY